MKAPRTPLSAALAAIAAACVAPHPMLRDTEYPGVLRAPAALPFDVVWQQRVTASWKGGQQRGFDAAVQKRGDTLTVIGLSPTGSAGFAVVMRGCEIVVENRTDFELPFPPRFILLDVQRALYPWLSSGGLASGARGGDVDGEQVSERYEDSRLAERVFRRLDKEGEIVVTYVWGRPDWRGPTRVDLYNGWFGYRLRVDTHAETPLVSDGGEL